MRPGDSSVLSFLLREEQHLVLLADFQNVAEDLDLHLLSIGLDHDPLVREILADGITALGLHLASRPIDEHVGWTVQLREPEINLFFTGNSASGELVGRAFTEPVNVRDEGLFIAQAKREAGDMSTSTVVVDGVDLYAMVEAFYEQSEQKAARFFFREPFVALAQALPGGAGVWLRGVESEDVFALLESDRLQHLAERRFRFRCGCDRDKIAGVLVGVYGGRSDALFGGDAAVEVECPRCAARLRVTREDYERIRAAEGSDG